MRKITIIDIANKAGVTKATVSLVLNNKPLAQKMLKETRDRIHFIAKELDYQPSFMAKSLSKGKTKTLGLIVGDIDTPYYAEMTGAALEAAEKHGQQLLISVTKWDQEKELECLNALMQRQVDGIIFCTAALTPDSAMYKKIIKRRFPIVLYNTTLKGISSISSDHKNGMHDALHLLSKNGHKQVAFVGLIVEDNNKQNEFEKACSHFGIEPICILKSTQKKLQEKVLQQLKSNENNIKALIICADHVAQMLIGFLSRQGILVPEYLDVISIDGTRWGGYSYPALTSIKQDCDSLMEKAVELLLNPPGKPQSVTIPTKLLIRDSVKINQNNKR